MSYSLLRKYIRMVLEASDQARVPTQLLSPEDIGDDVDCEEKQEIDEFSGVGSIAGYTAPLGTRLTPPKPKKRK